MKILHTADWHIGKKLHKHDLARDHELFFEWLIKLIVTEKVEVVLVSGDIFDLANSSSEARSLYYNTLVALNQLYCTVIITGRNHDSPAVLNAPKEVLKALNIHVFGALPTHLADCLIPLPTAQNPEIIIAAIPFLRDVDLRQMSEDESYDDRIEAIRKGISHTFEKIGQLANEQFPNIPVIALGHLFAAGASSSESERDIQIGNQAAFDAWQFGDFFNYIALGHIHKPQKVQGNVPIYYSGSPLPLSFSERSDTKRVLIIDAQNGFEPKNIPIPIFRQLKRLSGSIAEVENTLFAFNHIGKLETLLELEVIEDNYNPEIIIRLDRLVFDYKNPNVVIVKHRIFFKNQISGTASLYGNKEQLQDLLPQEVFQKRLEHEKISDQTKEQLQLAFMEILDEIRNNY